MSRLMTICVATTAALGGCSASGTGPAAGASAPSAATRTTPSGTTPSSPPNSTTPSTPGHPTPSASATTPAAGPPARLATYVALPSLPSGWAPAPITDGETADSTGAMWQYILPGAPRSVCVLKVYVQGGVHDDPHLLAQVDELRAQTISGTTVVRNEVKATNDPPGFRQQYETRGPSANKTPQHNWATRFISRKGTMIGVVGTSLDAYENRCRVKTLVDAVHWTGTEHPGP